MKGEWKVRSGILNTKELFVTCENVDIAEVFYQLPNAKANVQLILKAVNACIKLNPDNPLAVAESIKDLYEALKEVRDNSILQKEENGFYILRLSYASWQDACKALAKATNK